MDRKRRTAAVLLLALFLAGGLSGARGENPLNRSGADAPCLKGRYEGVFAVGAAGKGEWTKDEAAAALMKTHFDILACAQLSPEGVLDRSASIKSKNGDQAKLRFAKAGPELAFALENGMGVRSAPLAGADDTPRWFFAEKWSSLASAALADRDTMIRRMENWIRDVMQGVNERYPGAVYAWDVADSGSDGLWAQVIGPDWTESAFAFARQYAAEGQRLCFAVRLEDADGPALAQARALRDKGLLDGLHLLIGLDGKSFDPRRAEACLEAWNALGLEMHITVTDRSESRKPVPEIRLAVHFRQLFALLEQKRLSGWPLTGVDLASGDPEAVLPLLDGEMRCRPAFFGVLQDGAVPSEDSEEALLAALAQLGIDPRKEEAKALTVLKTLDQHNPVMVQRFCADPWAMVYNGRVYLYMTGDEPVPGADGKPSANTYGNITTLRVLSSDDLVNWQDHGSVNAAGRNGAARWASNSWAPCAAWKNIDGQDRFFLYFANSGGGIGVLTADSPTGPFSDPLGRALISRATPTCREVTWLFDPAVLVDDDGSAYLYFGGGIPEGREADPGTARAVKLGADMISLDGDPVPVDAPWLFEDSGINKMGDTYVYSYCSNFQVPPSGSRQGFRGGEIVYMTSDSPMGPFVYGGRVLQNPGSYFGVGGNNHHCMFRFGDEWYITYHAATVDRALGWNAGYRSTFVDRLLLTDAGLPALSAGTLSGVRQARAFDPFRPVPAATLASLAGAETRLTDPADRRWGTGDMSVVSTVPGGWIGIAGVDFRDGAARLTLLCAAPEGGSVEVLLDRLDGGAAAVVLPAAGQEPSAAEAVLGDFPAGVHDLYFRFTREGMSLLQWQFHAD